MKVLGYLISFLLMIIVTYNILRFVLVFIENGLHKDFGMEMLLHNSYIVNGSLICTLILIVALEIINHAIGEDKF